MSRPSHPTLGVCYYPEHWPEKDWPEHASQMSALGIRLVRIAEFAWSKIEPRRNQFDWDWLDRACDTLAGENLGIILCTPTASPPKWLLDEHPDIYALDSHGYRREFGSRRHYCFSSQRYRDEATRISAKVVERYADHPAVVGWQTDNEFGCHETTLSYSTAACSRFRRWLRDKYHSIDRLNEAWGTVFWSQCYTSFDAIELPTMTVTEANPAHRLDFQRFSSDQVGDFNALQVDLLREKVGDSHWICHNFMGSSLDFDHFDVAKTLDVASWDSYPLGFLDIAWFSESDKQRYRQTGHPDLTAFHHDLYFGVGEGRFGVMEQQPGPVNWAEFNATPRPGMVRLWSWEAIAHGAEFVSYFRWQQVPFAQEQMHSGLHRVDGSATQAAEEVRQLAQELSVLEIPKRGRAPVALVFDYESIWMANIQAQSRSFDPFELIVSWYSALRQLGIDVDILPSGAPLDDYALIVVPNGLRSDPVRCKTLLNAPGFLLLGPRSGSKTNDFQIPSNLPPGCLQQRIPIKVTAIDSIRDGSVLETRCDSKSYLVTRWLEHIDSILKPRAQTVAGVGVWYEHENTGYLNAWVCEGMLLHVLGDACTKAGVQTQILPPDVRISRLGELRFLFNYGPTTHDIILNDAERILGTNSIAAGDVAVWRATGV